MKNFLLTASCLFFATFSFTQSESEWFRQIVVDKISVPPFFAGIRIFPHDVKIDKDENVFIAFSINDFSEYVNVLPTEEGTPLDLKGMNVFAKYNKQGEVQWLNAIGGRKGNSYDRYYFDIDKQGDVLLAGEYFYKAFFDQDSIETSRAGDFLAKLDGETGATLWFKKIAATYYGSNFDIAALTLGEDDNIYIAFEYKNFFSFVDGLYMSTDRSPENAMAKFTPDGDIIWGVNTTPPWDDYPAKTRIFEYNPSTETIITAQSQGFYNIWSSCGYREWSNAIQHVDKDGNIIDTFKFQTSDIGALVAGALTDQGHLLGLGYFRGEMKIGPFQTLREGGCQENEGFSFLFEPNLSQVLYSQVTNDQAFYPLDVVFSDHYFYALGTNEQKRLFLMRFTEKGVYAGYRKIGQYADVFDFDDRHYLDVRNDHIVILGYNFQRDTSIGINPSFNVGFPSASGAASILKIKNDDWQTQESWMKDMNLDLLKEQAVFAIYPNPFKNHFSLIFNEKTPDYQSYKIFDLQGRLLLSGLLNGLRVDNIELSHLKQGAYVLHLTGGAKKAASIIIKG